MPWSRVFFSQTGTEGSNKIHTLLLIYHLCSIICIPLSHKKLITAVVNTHMKNSEYAPTTIIVVACWCLNKNLWAKTYGKWECMRSSAASGCKCTADTAYWVMDAAADSCLFVKRKCDNMRGPEDGWLLKTSRWLLTQTHNFWGWYTSITQHHSYLLGQNNRKQQQTKGT